jgi:hypothetical protein
LYWKDHRRDPSTQFPKEKVTEQEGAKIRGDHFDSVAGLPRSVGLLTAPYEGAVKRPARFGLW